MTDSRHYRIFLAGPLPPPLNGFSYITQEMAALLSERFEVQCIDLSPHLGGRGVGYHAARLWLATRAVAGLLSGKGGRGCAFYVGCDGGLGLAYTIALSTVARLQGYRIYIHHHSFAYINAWRVLMAILLAAAGPKAIHICLCETMASALGRRYGRTLDTAIVANAAFVPPQTMVAARRAGTLRIGLLSNLDNSKGLDVFLEIARRAFLGGLDVSAILAGPATSDSARAAIEQAKAELGSRLDYRGPVYDAAKQRFFQDIDVFIFPTRYVNEAQPTVIYEGFSYGIPTLTVDRGCIRTQVGQSGEVFAQDVDFVAQVMDRLERYLAGRDEFVRRRLDVQIRYVEQNRLARQAAAAVFKEPSTAQPGTP